MKNLSPSTFDKYFILAKKKTHLHRTRFANYDQLAIPFFKTYRTQNYFLFHQFLFVFDCSV